jgi:hypothetical protein
MVPSNRARMALAALLVFALGGVAALVQPADARVTRPEAPQGKLLGTVTTQMSITRFTAIGRRVVGRGLVVSTFRDTAGRTTVKRRYFRLTIRTRTYPMSVQQTMCHILFLEIGEVDLILAGLHATLRSANPGEPIQLRLQAHREGGILGRLFCDLTQARGLMATRRQAVTAARQLNKRLKRAMIMRVRAALYGPHRSAGAGSAQVVPLQVTECEVLHLVLGPVHLDLLGLVVDLNKIVLDLKAIPGTLLGNIFCQLVTPPPPPPAS